MERCRESKCRAPWRKRGCLGRVTDSDLGVCQSEQRAHISAGSQPPKAQIRLAFLVTAEMPFLSTEGARQIPLDGSFLAGSASADLKPEEILASVYIPHSRKVGNRLVCFSRSDWCPVTPNV